MRYDIVNKVLTNPANLNKKKHILFIIIISLITYFTYIIKYDSESVVLKIALYIITYRLLYNNSIYKSSIMILISMAIISAADMITSLIFIPVITSDQVRSIWYWLIICNVVVSLISIIISSIPTVKLKLRNTIDKINETSKKSTVIVLTMSIIVVTYTFYNISNNYNWSDKYIINIIVQTTYFLIMLIFLKDKLEYNNLMQKYDSLFEFFKEYEDSIDDIYLSNHEHKNQLAIIKQYLKNSDLKEAKEYLDNILENNVEDKMDIIKNLRYVPKGGIKGLLYYKIVCAKNKNTTIVLDIDQNVIKKLKELNANQNRIISKILGVYIDNAIEAVQNTHKRIVNIEIY